YPWANLVWRTEDGSCFGGGPVNRSTTICVAWSGIVLASAALADDPTGTSLKPITDKDWTYENASHLLARAGFGGPPAEVEGLLTMGGEEAVKYLVYFSSLPYETPPPPIDPELEDRPNRALLRSMTDEERKQ